jgi:hypothetical protein
MQSYDELPTPQSVFGSFNAVKHENHCPAAGKLTVFALLFNH